MYEIEYSSNITELRMSKREGAKNSQFILTKIKYWKKNGTQKISNHSAEKKINLKDGNLGVVNVIFHRFVTTTPAVTVPITAAVISLLNTLCKKLA